MKIVQIVSCVLACLLLAACPVVGIFCGLVWFLIPLCLSALCMLVMLFAKNKATPIVKKPDFMDESDDPAEAERGEHGADKEDKQSTGHGGSEEDRKNAEHGESK